jgi:hypothetical protein
MLIIDPDKGFVGIASVLGVAVCLVPCIVSDLFLTAWVGPQ